MTVEKANMKLVLPEEAGALSRRALLKGGVSLLAYTSVAKLLSPSPLRAAETFALNKRLIWINMSGGWDILEISDPKKTSTSGIDMIYDYGLTNAFSSDSECRLGRWLPKLATLGSDLLVINGLAMGTTSHQAGSIYMDTGVLSNTGRVNSASVPSILASHGASTIPLLLLPGGMDPKIDRGLLNPVSPVRAENLELYRAMYPVEEATRERRIAMLDYVKERIYEFQDTNTDRMRSFSGSEAKVRRQISDNVGEKLALGTGELSDFMEGGPSGLNRGMAESFALAGKLIANKVCDVINLGIGGFDTHSGQSQRLEPRLGEVDFLVSRLATYLGGKRALDDTLIVLYSDFGRTPKINSSNGRDHWPIGSSIFIGGGLAGGRTVGATNDNLIALAINADSGLPDERGVQINPTHIAGSVLEIALGSSYLTYRNYLSSIPAMTRLK